MATNYEKMGLPLDTSDKEVALMVDAAFAWIQEHTTLEFNLEDPELELPPNVKLFIVKFCDLLTPTAGVASESLGGMSQSFSNSGGTGFLLADLASQLLGTAYKDRCRFVSAVNRWK